MKLRILHIINNLGSGGAEKLLSDILPIIAGNEHHVSLMICNSQASVSKYHKKLEDHGIAIIDLKTSFYNPFQVFSIARLIRKGRFDIVHAHLFPTQYWLAFASLIFGGKTKLVKTEHSVFNERKQYGILKPLEKFVYSRYTKVVAISEQVKQNLADWLGRTHIEIIENGVNLHEIEEAKAKSKNQKFPFIDASRFNILMTGRFDGIHKDQKTLIEAVSKLKEVQLIFAGDGPALERIQEYAWSLLQKDQVHFLGMRTDVYALMSKVDLNVLSTNTEGLSGVTLESLASGKPFLGSDVDGVRDVVPDQRFLFPKQQVEPLAEKITELMRNEELREAMANSGMVHVRQYDLHHMVAKYLNLYESLIES